MDALHQKLVVAEELPAVSVLLSMRGGAGAVLGPALGGDREDALGDRQGAQGDSGRFDELQCGKR